MFQHAASSRLGGRQLLAEPRRRASKIRARADSPSRPPSSSQPPPPTRRPPPPRRPLAPVPAASTLAPVGPSEVVKQLPTLSQSWEDLSLTERKSYLEAVRDYHGRGVILEFYDVDGGRTIQALVEPEMVGVWREYSWREHPIDGLVGTSRTSAGSSASSFSTVDPSSTLAEGETAAGQEGEDDDDAEVEVQLHVLTAERIHVGGSLPDFVDVLCADGCPANCLVDNLSLKPWTPDATASGEWLQFRSRLEERWQWMQLEERYEKLSAEQAQRERRQLLMQAARQRLQAASDASAAAALPAAEEEEAAAAAAAAEQAAAGASASNAEDGAVLEAAELPTPADSMSEEEMDDLISSFFADPRGQAPQLLDLTTAAPASSSGADSALGGSSGGAASWEVQWGVTWCPTVTALLANPAPRLQLAASSSAAGEAAEGGALGYEHLEDLLPADEEEEEQEQQAEVEVAAQAEEQEVEPMVAAAESSSSSGRSAPQLPRPWRELSLEERRSYLEAVRDYHGQGVLCERVLRSGRTVLALIDPRMRPHWQAHTWRDSSSSGGRLFTEGAAGAHAPGRAYLAQWTAEVCVLGRATATGGPLAVARVEHKDGCPANCLARNLEVELRPGSSAAAAHLPSDSSNTTGASINDSSAATTAAAAASSFSNNILPAAAGDHSLPNLLHLPSSSSGGAREAAAQPAQPGHGPSSAAAGEAAAAAGAPVEAAPGAGHLRAAKLDARKALRSVYDWLGAERGREFFAQLHEEYLEAEREQQLLEQRREAAAAAAAPEQA